MTTNDRFQVMSLMAAIIFVLLCPHSSLAQTCAEVFPDGLQNSHSGASASVTFNNGSQLINSPTNELYVNNLMDGAGPSVSCDGVSCSALNTTVPSIEYNDFPGGDKITINYGKQLELPPGDYDSLTMSSSATLKLQSGRYSFSGDVNVGYDSDVVLNGSGSIQLYVKGKIIFNNQTTLLPAGAGRIFLYARNSIAFGSSSDIRAIVYSKNNVNIKSGAQVLGAVTSEREITLVSVSRVTYSPDDINLADSGRFCSVAAAVDHYAITHAEVGITCEAEPITITAFDSNNNPVAPPAGTQISLSTLPASGIWVGGPAASFDGAQTQITHYLQQTTPTTLNINVFDGAASEDASADPNITFTDVGLQFYGNAAKDPIDHQIAGTSDNSPRIRIIETNKDTGACVARVKNSTQAVAFGFECMNPSSCVSGQTLSLAGTNIAGNNSLSSGNSTLVNLNFDANGYALTPLKYSDVGQVRLHGALTLPEQGNNPELTVMGASNPFVVKPHTLVVSSVTRADATANPGTTSADPGFVAAGEAFRVTIEARNSAGDMTPNFGNESVPQKPVLDASSLTLKYPLGGSKGVLSDTNVFTKVGGNSGQFNNTSLNWSEVGSFTVVPRLTGDDYLSAGDIAALTPSATIGRFYPHRYELNSATSANTCSSGVPFSYMGEPAIALDYQLQASNLDGGVVTNYDEPLGYLGTASVGYVYENNDECLTGSGSCVFDRLSADAGQWQAGLMDVSLSDVKFRRGSAPEAPLMALQFALDLNDSLDSRPLAGQDVNPATTGDCTTDNSCSAVALGNTLNLHYGRLFLGSAYGPEALDLPVKFVTEYYNGTRWQSNQDDSCTVIARRDIGYPAGAIDLDANREVAVSAGVSRGEYPTGGTFPDGLKFSEGRLEHYFSAPGAGNIGSFKVDVDMNAYPWLTFDWNQDGAVDDEITGNYQFGSYRGHDRILYWREVLE